MAAPHSTRGPDWDPLAQSKQDARKRALLIRARCDPSAGKMLGDHLLRDYPPPPGAIVAGFWPLAGEIDLRPLLHELIVRGHEVLLPVTPRRGQALSFRQWRPGDEIIAERFGTMRPIGELGVPDFVLVPLLAFDRSGHRLGYGAGYYDRTLPTLPGAIAVGCAFAAQELDEVPAGPYDVRLAAIATERGIIPCKVDPS